MKIVVAPDRVELGRYVADQAAIVIRQALEEHDTCNIVVATGSSQFEVLDCLVQQAGIDWERVCGFHLDEYLGLARSHSASFCGYLHSRFVDRVAIRSFHYLDGTLPPAELKAAADQAISGQRIDLMLCGIGENGHLAFNDPPADFETQDSYLIVDLDEACRKQQVGEGWFDSLDQVPTQAISMSIPQMLKAKTILCAVPDRRKAAAVRDTVEGKISPQVPASALQRHAATTLVLDVSSSCLLAPDVIAKCEQLDNASGC